MRAQLGEEIVSDRIGLGRRRQGKFQRHSLAVTKERAAGEIPHLGQLLVGDAKVPGAQQRVRLAIHASGYLTGDVADQAAKAQIDLACRVHHRCVQLGKGLDQLGLALHGQDAVRRKAQRAQEEIKVTLQFGRGFGRQGFQAGHWAIRSWWVETGRKKARANCRPAFSQPKPEGPHAPAALHLPTVTLRDARTLHAAILIASWCRIAVVGVRPHHGTATS